MKRSLLVMALSIFACMCQAGTDVSGFQVFHIRYLQSPSNHDGVWTVRKPAGPGKPYIFTGPKGVVINSLKDRDRLLKEVVRASKNPPIITSSDLAEDAKLRKIGSRLVINLVLNESATRRMADFTRKNVGATMGAFLNGRLINLAGIMEPIVRGRIEVSGIRDAKEREQLIAGINRSRRLALGQTAKTTGGQEQVKPQPATAALSPPLITPKGKGVVHQENEFRYVEGKGAGFTQVYGTIHSDVRWTYAKSPYLVTENVYVAEDGSLTIEPGVTIKFVRNPDATLGDTRIGLTLKGRFSAEGTPNKRIVFTSASKNPRPFSEWSGISLCSYSPSILTWAVVRYGGSVHISVCALVAHCVFEHCHSGVWMTNWMGPSAIAEVRNNVCAYGAYSGVRCQGTQPYSFALDNIMYQNGDGVDCWGGAAAYLDYNLLFGNMMQYKESAIPGPHDLEVDPRFVEPSRSNYRLAADSPARGAGSDGGDIGLCEDKWSKESARLEKARFLGNGAMELWMQAVRAHSQRSSDSTSLCERALRKKMDPTLRDRITCYLADEYRQRGQNDRAEALLNDVLRRSKLEHLRDLARRHLARIHADREDYDGAMGILRQTKWPQSQTWKEHDMPEYQAMVGRTDEALAELAKTAKREAYGHIILTLQDIISKAIKMNHPDTAKAMLAGFEKYPMCTEAAATRLRVAYTLRDAKRCEEALELLKENDSKDPLNAVATESLFAMAELLRSCLGKGDDADQVLAKLVTNYIAEDEFVLKGREMLKTNPPPVPKNKLILLDESQNESSVFNRGNSGQWIGARLLFDAGFVVHTNGRYGSIVRKGIPTPDVMSRYGLIIMNNTYRTTTSPPLPDALIDNLVSYVEGGGSLMVIAGGFSLWGGREVEFYNPLMKRFGIGFAERSELPRASAPARAVSGGPIGEPFDFHPEYGVEVMPDGGTVLAYYGSLPIAVVKNYGLGKIVALGTGMGFLNANLADNSPKTSGINKKAFVRFVSYALSCHD